MLLSDDHISLERYFQVQIEQIYKTLEEIKTLVKETRTSNELKTYQLAEKFGEVEERVTIIENTLKFAKALIAGAWGILAAIVISWLIRLLGL